MPALNSPDIERFTLSNGLNVVLCHAPRLKRCAASLRVAAGSHDVSRAWPGLAHFLEHLFFLGTERFAGDQNLMSFVQRHGGQINASTRERTTDFFFELPAAVFADGVERLCDMLAHPRMTMTDQLREREVLHAEFIAWSRDAEARHQLRVLAPINPQHPLKGFHAGNRYSLAVPNPAFQQALRDFYARFYRAGQITLCLSAPLPLSELKTLAQGYGALFTAGKIVTRQTPPPLVPSHTCLIDPDCGRQPGGAPFADEEHRLHLLFACEGLPDEAAQAVAFLCHWMNAPQPGGLVAELRDRGLVESLTAAPLYQFGDQLLFDIECKGSFPEANNPLASTRETITRLIFEWLAFFKMHWPGLVDEYQRVVQRRLQTCGALELAHHYSRDGSVQLDNTALQALLAQLTREPLAPAVPMPDAIRQPIDWQLPPPNPFLRTDQSGLDTGIADDTQTNALVFRRAQFGNGDDAAIYLRWRLPCAQSKCWRVLDAGLKEVTDNARQAGVNLSFSAYGAYWQLKLTGLHAPMASIVEHALRRLHTIDDRLLARYAGPDNDPPLMPIRQLLKLLPDRVLGGRDEAGSDDPHAVWSTARWSALTLDLPPASEARVRAALSAMPGSPDTQASPVATLAPGKHWRHEASDASEDAVLVFCPVAGASIQQEAAWRMLAHLAQAPFYQRLRVELQLGYAVFSGLRQIVGRTGLLFGVQSPVCGAADLVRHIETFIEQLPALIGAANLAEQQRALTAQFDPASLPNDQLAELHWQAHLAGHRADYLETLRETLANLETHLLLEAARQLSAAAAGWLVVANRPYSLVDS